MQKISWLTAIHLRLALIVSMAVLVACGAFGFWLFHQSFSSYASKVSSEIAESKAGSANVSRLKQLQTEIEDDQIAITRTEKIVSDSKEYQYQNQIIDDINNYAKAAGIKIAGFTFSTAAAGAAATGSTAAVAAPSGLNVTTATIQLANPENSYQSIMNFLKSIELNLTKMNLSGISLQKDTKGLVGGVVSSDITIQVYTR